MADFGATRILTANQCYASLYGTSEYFHPDIFGKFYYSALNISFPKQTFTAEHELWSVGVTIFEAATGKSPFESKLGRDDPRKMYEMMTQKEHDCIYATDIDGNIQCLHATSMTISRKH